MVSIALDARRTQEARNVEAQRTRETRNLEAQRAHEAALQNYFEQVGSLLIEKPLRQASHDDDLSTVVRAQTLTVLEGLEPTRKRILLQFLYESELMNKDKPVVSLVSANLSEADLSDANLHKAALNETTLRETTLNEADLRWADLREADLSSAYLIDADAREADLREADLRGTDLSEADLSGADLRGAREWTEEQLSAAQFLEGTTMPNGQVYEDRLNSRDSVENGENSNPS